MYIRLALRWIIHYKFYSHFDGTWTWPNCLYHLRDLDYPQAQGWLKNESCFFHISLVANNPISPLLTVCSQNGCDLMLSQITLPLRSMSMRHWSNTFMLDQFLINPMVVVMGDLALMCLFQCEAPITQLLLPIWVAVCTISLLNISAYNIQI